MDQNILITGVGGFIGGKLFRTMQGSNIYGTVWNTQLTGKNIFRLDLADAPAVKKVLEEVGPKVVYHFAGMTSPKKNSDSPELSYRSHVASLQNILQCINPDTTHLIFLSTDKVFDGSELNPSELSTPKPSGLYGDLKLKCEQMIVEKMKRYHILRLSVVHSNGESNSTSVIDSSILKIKNNEKINIFTNVERCFADLTELVAALEKLRHNKNYGIYHFGSKLKSYKDRLIEICERDGVKYQGLVNGVEGQAVPMIQSLDTAKFRSLHL